MDYVTIDNTTYDLATDREAAEAALAEARQVSAKVWTCPQSSLEEAEAEGFEGAYPTVGVVFARVTDEAIRALRNEAAEAGDTAQVGLCDRALLGDAASRTRCERAICAAWAAAGV